MSDILTSLGAPVNTSTTDALAAIAQDSGLVGPDLAAAIGASPATVALLRQGASAEAIIRAWGFEHPFTPAVSAEPSSASSESLTITDVTPPPPPTTSDGVPDMPEPDAPFRCPYCGAELLGRG